MSTAQAPDFKPLMGTDEATIDDKGRLLIGKKKRERLGDDFVITLGTLGQLVAYPLAVWMRIYKELDQYELFNQGREQYTRLILGSADDDLKFDVQGRVVIPKKLRDLGKIKGDVQLVGCGERLEIWDRGEYSEYQKYPDVYGRERREAVERAWTMMRGGKREGAAA